MAAAVATKVKGTVITSSPGPIPAASRARCRALVPELTAMPKRASAIGGELLFKGCDLLPQDVEELSKTRLIASWISALID